MQEETKVVVVDASKENLLESVTKAMREATERKAEDKTVKDYDFNTDTKGIDKDQEEMQIALDAMSRLLKNGCLVHEISWGGTGLLPNDTKGTNAKMAYIEMEWSIKGVPGSGAALVLRADGTWDMVS